jgi:hypothetical protein
LQAELFKRYTSLHATASILLVIDEQAMLGAPLHGRG